MTIPREFETMKNRLSRVQWSASALAVGFSFACSSSQTPPAEAPEQPAPEAATVAVAAPAPAEDKAVPGPIVIKDVGLATPESIQYEPISDTYLVSNINGGPLDKDDNGFISKLSPEGKVLELKWIDGASAEVELNAPKGFGVSGGKLFVADIDVIRTFDLATGKPGAPIKVPGASFLNDVSVSPDGTVFVSDTGLKAGKEGLEPSKKDAIYKVGSDGKVSTLIKGESLGLPNGLSADADGVWVATWQGKLYRVSNDGKQEAAVNVPGDQLDGLLRTADGQTIISSWGKSTVYLGAADGSFSPLVADLKAPADLGYDSQRNQILVPLFTENAIQIHKVPQLTAAAKPATAPANATAGAK
jgi:SMP-30/Gluconolactonase/LRE-like region